MLKLIIADDEHRVCQLIENILPWEKYGIELSGTAYNGVDALQLIQDVRPDIVVTDIRMPGYDGITLIEKSKSIDPDISFIIISGYRDFEYAQRALKFGAEDYLLKPVSEDELKQIILRVTEKKTLKEELSQEENKLQRELSQSRKIIRKQLADEIVKNECIISASDVSNLQEQYPLSFHDSNFQIIIFQIDSLAPEYAIDSTQAIDTIMQKIELSISSNLENLVNEFLCTSNDFSLIYILNVVDGLGLSFKEIEHLHESAAQKMTEYGNWKISLCLGKPVPDIGLLHDSYVDAEFARRDRILRGCGKILEKRETPSVEDELGFFELDDVEKKIKEAVEGGDYDKIKNIFSNLVLKPNISHRVQNPDTILELCRFVSNSIIKQLTKLSSEDTFSEELVIRTEKVILTTGTLENLSSELGKIYSEAISDLLLSKRAKEYRPIRIAKEYIDNHFSENIDLNAVAKEAGFNPVYFSSLFKKEAGINFKEYLLQKRIETAKELLVSGNDTIMMISETVGYKDVRYFSRIFAKTVGIKPNMYRKIYG
ncbi:MAG: response regulator [Spirochaetales bacterium]|nr:response regulator [Spirochaetales bacterium]